MAWWNPKSWFNDTPAPSPSAPPDPFVWVALDPERPHMGIDFYSDAATNPFKYAICITGLTATEARSELVGKVLDWNKFTSVQLNAIEGGSVPVLSHTNLKAMYV